LSGIVFLLGLREIFLLHCFSRNGGYQRTRPTRLTVLELNAVQLDFKFGHEIGQIAVLDPRRLAVDQNLYSVSAVGSVGGVVARYVKQDVVGKRYEVGVAVVPEILRHVSPFSIIRKI